MGVVVGAVRGAGCWPLGTAFPPQICGVWVTAFPPDFGSIWWVVVADLSILLLG